MVLEELQLAARIPVHEYIEVGPVEKGMEQLVRFVSQVWRIS